MRLVKVLIALPMILLFGILRLFATAISWLYCRAASLLFVPMIIPIQCKVALTIKEAAEYSNIGINKLESLLRSPRCPFVLYVGKKKLVKRKEFEKFISDNVEI